MILLLLVLVLSALLLYSCATERAVRRNAAKADRAPITGVIRGLEAVTILPSSSQTSSATLDTACLLVHGFIGSPRDFGDFGEYLAQRGLTVRMMRLPGHCTTPVDFAYLSRGALLAAVRQEYLNLRREFKTVYVVGFSMGATLSVLLASQESVDRLVLAAPYYSVRYRWHYILPLETWNRLLRGFIHYIPKPEGFIQVNDRSVVHNIFTYDFIPTAGVSQLVELGVEARRKDVLEKVKCPVLMIHSSGDMAASFSASRRAYALLGSEDKESLWLTRSNHHIFWDYDRAALKKRIADFLLSDRPAHTPAERTGAR